VFAPHLFAGLMALATLPQAPSSTLTPELKDITAKFYEAAQAGNADAQTYWLRCSTLQRNLPKP
jgi:hypothetical protein